MIFFNSSNSPADNSEMQRYNLRDSDERKGQGDQLSL
jgi:hypothetical protein